MRFPRGKAQGVDASAAVGTTVLASGGGAARPAADPARSRVAQDELAFTDAFSEASTS